MTTQTISGPTYLTGGYTLGAGVTNLIIDSGVTIGGPGLIGTATASIDNEGTVMSTGIRPAVTLSNGGTLQNGSTANSLAVITGEAGIAITGGTGLVANYATIAAGGLYAVYLGAGGTVVNGSTADTMATISGGSGIHVGTTAGTVGNFGTITASSAAGVELSAGGTVTNGTALDTTALISGYFGVAANASATVANFGRITGTEAGDFGIALYAGGRVTNGSTADATARISGGGGIEVQALPATITNYGTISGASQDGVELFAGGPVTNGSASDTTALIQGYTGILTSAAGSIANFGTIGATGIYADAIYLSAASLGTVTNGSSQDLAASITGGSGISAGSTEAVVNFATVTGTNRAAIILKAGGSLTNGSAQDTVALVHGYGEAIVADGPATIANFGTLSAGYGSHILGTAFAVDLTQGGSIVNGSKADRAALISGFSGIWLEPTAAGTVTNFGEIEGTGGVAIQFGSTADLLAIEGGASFDGEVLGAGGTLLLDGKGGAGMLDNFGNYIGFSTIEVAAGANWTLATDTTIAPGSTLSVAGKLTSLASLDAGAYAITVTGTGQLANGSATDTAATVIGTQPILLDTGARLINFGTIAGSGVGVSVVAGGTAATSIVNFGTISSSAGTAEIVSAGTSGPFVLVNGSNADHGAYIVGFGVDVAGNAIVDNFGEMKAVSYQFALTIGGNGTVTNGSAADTAALMVGGDGLLIQGNGSVTNFGTIAPLFEGISVGGSARLVNGSAADTAALIAAPSGISLQAGGTVANFGTIGSTYGAAVDFAAHGPADAGGTVINGSKTDRAALISGRYGIDAYSVSIGPVTVVNYGTIDGIGSNSLGTAVYFAGPSDVLVVEGGSTLLGRVYGDGGTLELGAGGGAGTFANLGDNAQFDHFGAYLVEAGATWTLTGTSQAGTLVDDGTVISAGTIEATVRLQHASFVNQQGATLASSSDAIYGAPGSGDRVTNLGTITAGGFAAAVALSNGGTLVNGSNSDTAALINGWSTAVEAADAGLAVANYGTIDGVLAGWDLVLGTGGTVTNGSLIDSVALIDGLEAQGAAARVTNFATIAGGAVTGLELLAGGSVVNGSAADRLALIKGTGGVALLGAGTVTNFGTIAATVPGEAAVRLGSAQGVVVDEGGAVFQGAVLGGGGTLELAGGAGAGRLTGLGGSVSGFALTEVLTGAAWTLASGSTIAAGTTLASNGALTFSGTTLVEGTLAGTGSVTFAGGAATLATGAALTVARWSVTSGATVTDALTALSFGGSLTLSGAGLLLTGTSLTLTGAATFNNAGFGRGGTLITDGASAVAGFTLGGAAHWQNDGMVTQTGQLVIGDNAAAAAEVQNLSGGTIDLTGTGGISLGGGAQAFNLSNAGLIEKTGSNGTSMIGVAIENTGTISVARGRLQLEDAVNGMGGSLEIAGNATLELGAAVGKGQALSFSGADGTLVLDQPASFAAAISGLGGTDRIDLIGFAHGAGETLSYAAKTSGPAGGTLTVTDGALTAKIALFGQYAAGGFKLAAAGAGSSVLTYTPPPSPALVLAAHG